MSNDWTQLAEAFTLGAFPWISQLKRLKIHFEMTDLDVAAILNFFASLFALGIYGYFTYAHPTQAIDLPHWYVFLTLSAMLTVIYFGNFIWQRKQVLQGSVKWPVIFGFVLYLGIFSLLTAGFGTLHVLKDFVVIEGNVVDSSSSKPVDYVDVEVKGDNYRSSAITDNDGHFKILVKKSNFEDLTNFIISKPGHLEKTVSLSSGFAAISTMKLIKLEKR